MLKLIASDLDGTLLNRQQKISPLNRYAIAKAQERGCGLSLQPVGTTPGSRIF